MSINQKTEELGIDVIIDFEGISKITEDLQKTIRADTGKDKVVITTSDSGSFNTLKKILEEIQIKIDNISQITRVETLKKEVVGKKKKTQLDIKSLDELIKGSTTGSSLLTEHAIKRVEKILETKFDENKTTFSELIIDDKHIKSVFRKIETKGYKEAEKLAKEHFGESSDIVLKEMKKVNEKYKKQKQSLTATDMVALLDIEQGRQSNVWTNPMYETDLLFTLEKFRVNAIDEIDTTMRKFIGEDISVKSFIGSLDTKIEKIDELMKEELGKKTLGLGRKEELKVLGNQIKTMLVNFKAIASDVPDNKTSRKLIEDLYNHILGSPDIPMETTDLINSLTKELGSSGTMSNLASLRIGEDLVGEMLKSIKATIDAPKTKKFMSKTVEEGFSKISSTAISDTMGTIAEFVGKRLLDYVNIEESAKVFKEKYLPDLNTIGEIFSKISKEKLDGKEVSALVAGMEMIQSLLGFKANKVRGLISMFEVFGKMSANKGEIVTKMIKDIDYKKEVLEESLQGVGMLLTESVKAGKLAATQAETKLKGVKDAEANLVRIDKATQEIEERFTRLLPDEATMTMVNNSLAELNIKVEQIKGVEGEFEPMIRKAIEDFATIKEEVKQELTRKGFASNLAETIVEKLSGNIGDGL